MITPEEDQNPDYVELLNAILQEQITDGAQLDKEIARIDAEMDREGEDELWSQGDFFLAFSKLEDSCCHFLLLHLC